MNPRPDPSPEETGPSERTVALARTWLSIGGLLWLVLGVGTMLTGGFGALAATLIALAAVHFLLARFANRRCAVLLVMLGLP
jgi:hypothetical protein